MNTEQQASAKALYFQTNLTNTQIAEALQISRRTLHHWIRQNNWDRVRQSTTYMPTYMAEYCYQIFGRLAQDVLSEDRIKKPITHKEADILHKLMLTANKMKNRATLNENLEMLGFFMESVGKESREMATAIMPFVDKFIAKRAAVNMNELLPEYFNEIGLIPVKEKSQEEIRETQLDIQDIMEWTAKDTTIVDIEAFRSKVDPIPDNPPADYFNAPTAAPQEPVVLKEVERPVVPVPIISGSEAEGPASVISQNAPVVIEPSVSLAEKPVLSDSRREVKQPVTSEWQRRPLTDPEQRDQELKRMLEKYRDHTGRVDTEKFLEDALASIPPIPDLDTLADFPTYRQTLNKPQNNQNNKAA